MANQVSIPRSLIIIIAIAAIGLVLGFMNISADFLNTLLLAWIIVLVASPLLNKLKSKLPVWLAFLITLVATVTVFLTLGGLLVVGGNRFIQSLPDYSEQVNIALAKLDEYLLSMGIDLHDASVITGFINPQAMLEAFGNFLLGLIGSISGIILVGLLVIFMMLESLDIPGKLRLEIGAGNKGLERLFTVSGKLRDYVSLTSIVGLATGVLDTIWFVIMGVEFPILWGVLAFILSYIPSLGFWLAAIPPSLLAWLDSGPIAGIVVFLGIVLINGIAENVIKPKYMGEGLNLSPFMIIFSVIFWAKILGPLGSILGVPVTLLLKEVVLEGDKQTQWIARLMSSSKDPHAREEETVNE